MSAKSWEEVSGWPHHSSTSLRSAVAQNVVLAVALAAPVPFGPGFVPFTGIVALGGSVMPPGEVELALAAGSAEPAAGSAAVALSEVAGSDVSVAGSWRLALPPVGTADDSTGAAGSAAGEDDGEPAAELEATAGAAEAEGRADEAIASVAVAGSEEWVPAVPLPGTSCPGPTLVASYTGGLDALRHAASRATGYSWAMSLTVSLLIPADARSTAHALITVSAIVVIVAFEHGAAPHEAVRKASMLGMAEAEEEEPPGAGGTG